MCSYVAIIQDWLEALKLEAVKFESWRWNFWKLKTGEYLQKRVKSKDVWGRGAGGCAEGRGRGLHQSHLQVRYATILVEALAIILARVLDLNVLFQQSYIPLPRFRPLNDTEERTGSKVIVKFPSGSDDQCVSISGKVYMFDKVGRRRRGRKCISIMWCFRFWSLTWLRAKCMTPLPKI